MRDIYLGSLRPITDSNCLPERARSLPRPKSKHRAEIVNLRVVAYCFCGIEEFSKISVRFFGREFESARRNTRVPCSTKELKAFHSAYVQCRISKTTQSISVSIANATASSNAESVNCLIFALEGTLKLWLVQLLAGSPW